MISSPDPVRHWDAKAAATVSSTSARRESCASRAATLLVAILTISRTRGCAAATDATCLMVCRTTCNGETVFGAL